MVKFSNEASLGKLFYAYLEEISSDENSEDYLRSEGQDPDQLVEETIKIIKARFTPEAGLKVEDPESI